MRMVLQACAVAGAVLLGAAETGHARAAVCARGIETGFGVLDVSSDPPAKITIDDAEMGKVTPQPHLDLAAGHHKLKLETLDKKHARTIGFTIHEGQTTKLTLYLGA